MPVRIPSNGANNDVNDELELVLYIATSIASTPRTHSRRGTPQNMYRAEHWYFSGWVLGQQISTIQASAANKTRLECVYKRDDDDDSDAWMVGLPSASSIYRTVVGRSKREKRRYHSVISSSSSSEYILRVPIGLATNPQYRWTGRQPRN